MTGTLFFLAAALYLDPSQPIETRVKDLLRRMTLEEKVGQLNMYWAGEDEYGKQGRVEGAQRALAAGLPEKAGTTTAPGFLFGFAFRMKPEAAFMAARGNEIQRYALARSRLKIPVLWVEEGVHGLGVPGATQFPQPIALGSTWDTALVEEVGAAIGTEARAIGVHQLCTSPVMDVYRDIRQGRTEQGYSEDPYLVERMGVAQVKGMQRSGAMATLSHFAGQGEARRGIERGPAEVSERTFREVCLRPYEAAVKEAGAGSVMAAYTDVGGVPCHANRELLTKILREEWGFEGYVMGDSQGVEMLHNEHFVASTMQDAGVMALEAGVDVNFPNSHAFGGELCKAVREGKVAEASVDRAVARVLRVKFRMGLFERPYVDAARAASVVNSAAHRALALRAARESLVLVKNQGGLLPLGKSGRSLLVVGPNAHTPVHLLGGYTARPSGVQVTTVVEAIRRKVAPGVTVRHVPGCTILGGTQAAIEEAGKAAREVDLTILVVGDSTETAQEGRDRADLNLPGVQLDLVKAIHAAGKPVVLVLVSGRPVSMSWEAEHIPAILQAFYPGEEGGNAIADALFGDYNPGGKLAYTVPRSVGQLPLVTFDKPTPTRKYVDMPSTPLYEFGYGLSYTTFVYDNLRVEQARIRAGESVRASVDVANSGSRAGDEVVELYFRDLYSSVTRPVKILGGFRRIALAPGEKKAVEFTLSPDQLALWDRNMKRVVEPGGFKVMVRGLSESFEVAP